MDFSLGEEHEAIAGLAKDIFGRAAPMTRVEQVEAADERFDRDLWRDLADSGLLAAALPESVGGSGLGCLGLALLSEEHGRSVAPVPVTWHLVSALALASWGSAEQAQRWAAPAASGSLVLTCALRESTNDLRQNGGTWSGRVPAVPYAHVADAVLLPVGHGLFLLDLRGSAVHIVSSQATNRELESELVLDGAALEPVGGSGGAAWLQRRVRMALAATAAGVTRAALTMTAKYTSEREQFEKPLSTFQGVALKAADAYVDTTAIRAAALQAAWLLDRGDSGTADSPQAAAAVLSAAWWAAEAGQHCVHITQHLHGGMGADITYPVHRYFLWGKQIELMVGGASALLAEIGDVVASDLPLGDEIIIAGHEAVVGVPLG
jgi:acyl-CoA dehydrogenase